MPTAIVSTEQDAIVSEIDIAAPPQRVFQALTDAEQLKQWFRSPECPPKLWEMDARLEGKYRYATEGSTEINGVSDFQCHGHITEYDPPKLLTYTWFANWHDDRTVRTLVRWELTELSGGTHVKVTHSGLSNLPVARKDYTDGWPEVLGMLRKFAESK